MSLGIVVLHICICDLIGINGLYLIRMGLYKFSTNLLYQTFIYTEKSGDWWNWNKKTWFWHTYIYGKYKYTYNSCIECITKICIRVSVCLDEPWSLVNCHVPPPPRNPRVPLWILKRHHWMCCAGGEGGRRRHFRSLPTSNNNPLPDRRPGWKEFMYAWMKNWRMRL